MDAPPPLPARWAARPCMSLFPIPAITPWRKSFSKNRKQGNSFVEFIDLAADVVSRARRGGATDAECMVREGAEFSVRVRLGEVEQIKEAASKAIGLRVLQGGRAASAY